MELAFLQREKDFFFLLCFQIQIVKSGRLEYDKPTYLKKSDYAVSFMEEMRKKQG